MSTIKCSVREGRFVDPCDSLDAASEYGHPTRRSKGLFAWALSNPNGPTRTMYGVKSGEYVKEGMVFNFCPFCGANISAPIEVNGNQSSGGAGAKTLTKCAAGRDGECGHAQCPQLCDNEPAATGRHCPLDNNNED
jgi:hypothetical protein